MNTNRRAFINTDIKKVSNVINVNWQVIYLRMTQTHTHILQHFLTRQEDMEMRSYKWIYVSEKFKILPRHARKRYEIKCM